MSSRPTEDDLARIADAAIAAELASPDRRPLLLGRLAAGFRASLAVHTRPADQLRADLKALADEPDRRALDGWLIEARNSAAGSHPVEAHLFDRYRARRHAVLVAGGKPVESWARSALITADVSSSGAWGPSGRWVTSRGATRSRARSCSIWSSSTPRAPRRRRCGCIWPARSSRSAACVCARTTGRAFR